MQIYPAYTVEKIETELSWRVLGELAKNWETGTSSFQKISRMEKMMEVKFGIKKVSVKPLHGKEVVDRLMQEGWL